MGVGKCVVAQRRVVDLKLESFFPHFPPFLKTKACVVYVNIFQLKLTAQNPQVESPPHNPKNTRIPDVAMEGGERREDMG